MAKPSHTTHLGHYTNKIVTFTMIILTFCGLSMVISDIYAPFTTHAYLDRNVLSVSSQVPGVVEHLQLKNGDYVEQGDLLFSVDKADLIESRDIASANLVIIQQHLDNLAIEVEIAKDKIVQQEDIVENSYKHFQRYQKLLLNHTISQELFDDAKLEYRDETKELELNKLDLNAKQIKLGENGENGSLMLAVSILNRAKHNLEKSVTYTPISGLVTNLKLDVGQFIDRNTPQVAITSTSPGNLIANFNEKSLAVLANSQVLVVFDAKPGEIFHGRVNSVDSAVKNATSNADDAGQEAYVKREDRWIRKSQQVRSTIIFEQPLVGLVSGSKATVMVVPEDAFYWRTFSNTVMHLISFFRYIY